MKWRRIRPGYYESDRGHSIERHDARGGNPMAWVILYPCESTGDVSRPTLVGAKQYVEDWPYKYN